MDSFPPNPALAPLAFLIGDWLTSSSHPALDGRRVEGRTGFQWDRNGAFLVMRQHIAHPDFPDGIAYFGSDDQAGRLIMIYYDVRTVSRIYDVTAGERTLQWRRLHPEFAQTMTISADEQGTGLVSQGRLSQNGAGWADDLAQTFIRAPAAVPPATG